MPQLSRRAVLALLSKLSCSLYVAPFMTGGCGAISPTRFNLNGARDLERASPIDRLLDDNLKADVFFGDSPSAAHAMLWNKTGYLSERGGIPKPTEHRRIVVVGGGVSGLTTAYLLRSANPLVLERDSRFGGNSKGQSWRGIDYSIGAAYFCLPDEGSLLNSLFNELGLSGAYRTKNDEDPLASFGVIHDAFWSGRQHEGLERRQIERVKRHLLGIFNEEIMLYPEATLREQKRRNLIDSLDRLSLRSYLERNFGKLYPMLAAVIEQFCWSSFAASASEVSASAGLNFLAAEFGEIAVFPGGNSAFTEALYRRLHQVLEPHSLRAESTVIDVRVAGDRALVTYLDDSGDLTSVSADRVVMACPKFVVAKLIDDLEPERLSAISALEYRAYLVANVLVDGRLPGDFYDLYLLGDLGAQGRLAAEESRARGATDVINATYARQHASSTVLTLYQSLPYKGGRSELLSEQSYGVFKARFERQLAGEILPLLGVDLASVRDIRMTRWGHPIPVAHQGLHISGVVDRIQKPYRERVFFVEQDNWVTPAIETAVGEAEYWANVINRG
jgi:phytoene dehydrogenase-like protein